MRESSNRSPLSCASCRAGQIPAVVAPVGAPRNGEGRMLRKSAVAAAVAMHFALPALATNPPAAPAASVSEGPEGKVVHVKFKDGESEYSIGPDVPILAPVPGDKSLLKPGAAVFLAGPKGEDGSVTANFMYVEKDGIKPPM